MSLTKKEKVVLAIYPNALGLGYALFESTQALIYQQLIRVRPMCNGKCKSILKKLMRDLKPDVVILEDTTCTSSRKRGRVMRLLKFITKQAKLRNMVLFKYSRNQIREVFSVYKAQTKYAIACQIAEWFPKLKSKLPRPWKLGDAEGHNQGMFDAVSLGLTHYYLR